MKLLIRNGTLIDPKNGIHAQSDLWLEDGKVIPPAAAADEVIDAAGKVVCPGFIDIHMHEDPVDAEGHIEAYDESSIYACMLHMGVTTAVGGNCGENKYHPADYLDIADRDGVPVNVAMLAGHEYFRKEAGCTDRYAPTTAPQRAWMSARAAEALDRGCLGVSFGIRYQPGMDAAELKETAAGCTARHKLVAAHIRNDAAGVFDAAREFLDAGLALEVPIEVSHIGSMAGFGQMAEFLDLIDEYRKIRSDIFCDCYPYDAFSTQLGSATYDEGWRDRYGCDYGVVELCLNPGRGIRATEELFYKVRAEHPECVTVCHVMHQEDVDLAFRHPSVMIGSDGTLNRGRGHPRACGTFPRVLSRYVRNGVLTLDDAVRRITAMPAAQLGLGNKGHLGIGADADVVIFDPEKIEDLATFEVPLAPPAGIDRVIVNGKTALLDGNIIHRRAGRSVRG